METHGGIAGRVTGHVVFGWDPIWVSGILFLATYAAIVTEKVNRAVVALTGAGLMISQCGSGTCSGNASRRTCKLCRTATGRGG